jgi:hypothetical protein
VKVFRVQREAPPAPELPRMPGRLFATRADQNGASFYTYRWQPLVQTATHVFRAFDEAVFQVDWSHRPGPALDPTKLELFPSETVDHRWNSAKRQQVATELNQLNTFAHDDAGTAQAFAYYRGLSPDALRVLASLPDNDAAFTQITTAPLYPEDPANNNRRGPDDPDSFHIGDPGNPLASPSLRALVDTLEGHIPNRNFYRAAYVDAAHNQSVLSLATPPVFVPNTTPPRSPAVSKAAAGERQITLSWTPNREPDVVRYNVYRTDDEDRAQDVRLMSLVHVQNASAADPAELSWTDTMIDTNRNFYYRLVAEDLNHNASKPSPTVAARAYDTSRPVPPLAEALWNDAAHVVTVVWNPAQLPQDLELSLQRSDAEDDFWLRIKGWTPAIAGQIDDATLLGGSIYQYKLRARNKAGRTSDNEPVIGPISIPENI